VDQSPAGQRAFCQYREDARSFVLKRNDVKPFGLFFPYRCRAGDQMAVRMAEKDTAKGPGELGVGVIFYNSAPAQYDVS
jgi:hypothetical protein